MEKVLVQRIDKKKISLFITLFCASFTGSIVVLSVFIISLVHTDIFLPFMKDISLSKKSEEKLEKQVADLERRFPPIFSLSKEFVSLQEIADFLKNSRREAETFKSLSTQVQNRMYTLSKTIDIVFEKIRQEIKEISVLQQEITAIRSLITKDNNLEILKKNMQTFHAHDLSIKILISANALKVAVDRGESYNKELQIFSSLVLESGIDINRNNSDDLNTWKLLHDYAAHGLPSTVTLAADFSKTADEIVRTENNVPDDANIWQKLLAKLQSIIVKRPIGEVDGTTTPALAARMEVAISKGNYIQALYLWQKLPQLAKNISADFMMQLNVRYKIDNFLSQFISKAITKSEETIK